MIMVATDGHRLAKVFNNTVFKTADTKIVIPRKGVFELGKVLEDGDEDISFWLKDNHIIFQKNYREARD